MLSQKKMMEISLFCHERIGDAMSLLCNPKYRGPNFSWDTFPEKVSQSCRISVVIHVVIPERMRDACQDYAEQQARYIANLWVKNMTE